MHEKQGRRLQSKIILANRFAPWPSSTLLLLCNIRSASLSDTNKEWGFPKLQGIGGAHSGRERRGCPGRE